MWISKVKLNNYVCFYDEEAKDVKLDQGINFVLGKNDSGKTVLMDALSHRGKGESHKSKHTSPERDPVAAPKNETHYEFEYRFDEKELLRILLKLTQSENIHNQFFIPVSESDIVKLNEQEQKQKYVSEFLSDGFNLRCIFRANELDLHSTKVKRFDDISVPKQLAKVDSLGFSISPDLNRKLFKELTSFSLSNSRWQWQLVSKHIPEFIYKFDAERRPNPTSSPNRDFQLKPDASNLAQVVKSLKDEEGATFQKYLNYMRTIFPEIHEILMVTSDNNVEIKIGYYPPLERRSYLAPPLSKCGTGIGQVMAMLYIVVYHDKTQPRVIIIDEPNSFLHPGAVRKLLEIFQKHDHHQYIIATHSPTAIMSVKKKRILLVKKRENNVSIVKSRDVKDNSELEDVLKELGTKRSDIFGMDAVIWVEGKTDATSFKIIMDEYGGLPGGVEIIDLVHTGDLKDKKRGALIEQIYARLSGSVGILPSVLAFVFDGDLQNDDFEETDTRKFLPRQNFESYLIYPEILADILNRDAADDKPKGHTTDTVKQWIRKQESKEFADLVWLKSVDGAMLLNKMFQDLAGISYKGNKVRYGEEITRRILEKNKDHFQEIVELIKKILAKDQDPETT